MENKIFINSSIATKEWKRLTKKTLWFLLFMPLVLLVIPACILWFITLGHVNFMDLWFSAVDRTIDKKLEGKEEISE